MIGLLWWYHSMEAALPVAIKRYHARMSHAPNLCLVPPGYDGPETVAGVAVRVATVTPHHLYLVYDPTVTLSGQLSMFEEV